MADASVNAAEKALEGLSLKSSGEAPAAKPAATEGAAPAAEDAATPASEGSATPAAEGTAAAPQGATKSGSLYVGELDPSVTEAVLFESFQQVGSVASIRVCRDAVSRESLGYAYVNYHSEADAAKAMEELNYALINGRPVRIMWSQRDPSKRKSGKGNIFIKNLDPSIDNKALHDTFSAFGEISSAKVVTDPEGNSQGFGFIHFKEPESAANAIKLVNGMVLNDREVYVAYHIPRNERESKAESLKNKFTNVYVKNLDPSLDQKGLEELFGKFGEITSAVLSTDAEGKTRGFGFVNYATHESAQKAVEELNGTEAAEGKKLYVGRAQNKFERQTELKKQYEAARLEKLTKYQSVNLYIRNLDDQIDDEKLKEAFNPFGTITSARVMTDDNGKSRGFGFVCFSAPDEANRAIGEMNQHMLAGKPLYVTLAQRKDLRQNQMRQQHVARNQLRLQQQAAVAGGLGGQFVGAPMLYPGGPGFLGGPPGPGGARVPFPGNPQMMMPPRGGPPVGQWQAGPGGPGGPGPRGPGGPAPYGYPGAPGAGAEQEAAKQPDSLAAVVASVPEEAKKQVIGEALYPKILADKNINNDGELAGKITGMLLDMENDELIALADDEAALQEQVGEALSAYKSYLESQGEEAA